MEECCKQWEDLNKDWIRMWDLLECGQPKKSKDHEAKVTEASKIWARLKQNTEFVEGVYADVKGPHERQLLTLLSKLYELDQAYINEYRNSNQT